MNFKKIVAGFYAAYTLYVFLLIGTTTMDFLNTSLALIFMWVNYAFFLLGYNLKKRSNLSYAKSKREIWMLKTNKLVLLTIAGTSLIFSVAVVNYYTGQTPTSVIENLTNNVSLYYEYQNYFQEQQRNVFTITKIPFILMIFIVKIILLYSYIVFFIKKEKTSLFEKIYLLLITCSFIYIGVGRGTSFEFFELLILIIFILFSTKKKSGNLMNVKSLVIGLLLSSLAVYIFISGINARGVEFDPSIIRADVNYDPQGWLPTISSSLAVIVFRLYAYFGFGFFYISIYLTETWFASINNFFMGLFPWGYELILGNSVQDIMGRLVDVGVKWHPDFSVLINDLGYVGMLMICLFIGLFCGYSARFDEKTPIVELTNYVILLQMISLPVGNFLFTSSANQLIVFSLLIYWIWKIFINRRFVI
ncbi:hypothetical protein L2D08_01855 [Domibacillus sp. PGB-M46]|uniref:hypothetical protein n=1 Tax=Domibacillus sp. PGB-M46 TaxID=2910255 RepID=UPI001F56DB32|nr:hypothetical protein [Domibacillus sp. PGB-M46]MCI2253104.1 hypothetical protein [Domibacillus sp. PGB-M46]